MGDQGIKIPSDEECRRLVGEAGMLDNIAAHCRQVCRVSLLIFDYLKQEGLNRDLIRVAALLHDITKTRSFKTLEDHAETGEQLLLENGYPEVGRIVGQHVRLDSYFASPAATEAEVVNYADKRVLHDRVVPLSERMGYILKQYGRGAERERMILLLWKKSEELEARLFAGLPFTPNEIDRILQSNFPSTFNAP